MHRLRGRDFNPAIGLKGIPTGHGLRRLVASIVISIPPSGLKAFPRRTPDPLARLPDHFNPAIGLKGIPTMHSAYVAYPYLVISIPPSGLKAFPPNGAESE